MEIIKLAEKQGKLDGKKGVQIFEMEDSQLEKEWAEIVSVTLEENNSNCPQSNCQEPRVSEAFGSL